MRVCVYSFFFFQKGKHKYNTLVEVEPINLLFPRIFWPTELQEYVEYVPETVLSYLSYFLS